MGWSAESHISPSGAATEGGGRRERERGRERERKRERGREGDRKGETERERGGA